MDKSFNAYIENSIRENRELTALSDFKGVSYNYKDIARKIENELEYPGQIKVNVIRETRSVDIAK